MIIAQSSDHGTCLLVQRSQDVLGKRREPRLDYVEDSAIDDEYDLMAPRFRDQLAVWRVG